MKGSNGIRKSKGFRYLSTFIISLFLFSIGFNSLPSSLSTKADTISPKKDITAEEDVNLTWRRTKDYRNEFERKSNDGSRVIYPAKPAGYINLVHNSKFYESEYWKIESGIKTMKNYDDIINGSSGTEGAKSDESGIFVMDNLFKDSSQNIVFNYETLSKLMKPEDTNVWDGKEKTLDTYAPYRSEVVGEYLSMLDGQNYLLADLQNAKEEKLPIKKLESISKANYPNFSTWQYMIYDNSTIGPDQMRLFTGEFEATSKDLEEYDYYITADDGSNIIGVDDTIMVLVDGIPTGINYTTSSNYNKSNIQIETRGKNYDVNFEQTKNSRIQNRITVTCPLDNEENIKHAALSIFADTLHVHLDEKIDDKVIGCISDEMAEMLKDKPGTTTHKLDIIASDHNLSGGMTKLKVVKVPKPEANLVKEALVDDEVVSSSRDTVAISNIKEDDTINYRFTYENTSKLTLFDITFEDDLLDAKITSDKVTIGGKKYEVSDVLVKKYDSTGKIKEEGDASILKEDLLVNEKIVVTSDYFTHVPTEEEVELGKVVNTVKTVSKYIDFYGEGQLGNEQKVTVTVIKEEGPKEPSVEVIKLALDNEGEVISDNKKTGNITLGDAVFYKFNMTNNGEVDLSDVTLKDGRIGLVLSSSGLFINTVKVNTKSLRITKYSKNSQIVSIYNGDTSKDSELKEIMSTLKTGERIEVADTLNIREVPKEVEDITNIVVGEGKFGTDEEDKVTDDDKVIIKVDDMPKVVVILDAPDCDGEAFEVIIEGSDGSKAIVKLKDTEKITINDLIDMKYGVEYTVSQVEKSDYELTGINTGNGFVKDKSVQNNIKFTLDEVNKSPGEIIIHDIPREKEPDEDFKQEIDVQKEAYVDNELVASSEENISDKVVSLGKTIEYKLSIKNNGARDLKNVILDDETLKVIISGDGITKNSNKVNSPSLVVIKYDKDGNIKDTGSEKDLNLIMAELKVYEKIVVSDKLFLSEKSEVSGTIINKVIGKGKYERKDVLTDIFDDATVNVKVVEDSKVKIDKYISKVIREGKMIYDSSVMNASNIPERLYPEDKVEFGYTITNNGESKMNNLFLKDILTNLSKDSLPTITEWKFTKNGQAFDHTKFSLNKGEVLNLVSNNWVIGRDYIRNNENVVDLMQKEEDGTDKLHDSDKELVIVYPKVFVNMVFPDVPSKDIYVTVKGDNGFETGMYIHNGDRVDISDLLDFDVKYTVTETIPMNVTLEKVDIKKGTDINGKKEVANDLAFTLDTVISPEDITLYNHIRPSDEFQAESKVTNTLIVEKK